jgi:hypothetical protein
MDTSFYDEDLQRSFEQNAGLVVTGPDTDSVSYTLNNNQYSANYVDVKLGGFISQEAAKQEIFRFVMSREFYCLGNPIRLQRVSQTGPTPIPMVEGIPSGPILIWRPGHTPHYEVDDNGVWQVAMAWLVLPPFVLLAEEPTNGGARAAVVAPNARSRVAH